MLTIKLACGNVRRSIRDFSIYFVTLAFAACLLYSFLASTDYLLALDLTLDQRALFAKAGAVLQAFAVFIDVIFCFLLGYANAFLLRRRKREFALYLIVGLEPRGVAAVLAIECALVGTVALTCGLLLGWALSPVFSLVATFVFGVPWHPVLVFSATSAAQCACSFLVISAIAAMASVRGVCKRPIVELIHADRVPEKRRLAGVRSLRVQKIAAAILLALVWGVCLLQPGYFIVFIIPMGFIALFGSYFLIRVLYATVPERLRRRPERYWTGVTPFTVRQLEARAESGAMAMAAECVLLAASMCMTLAGLAFSVGMRAGSLEQSAQALLPVAYSCVFYGAAFLVAAAAVLALQQLAQASEAGRSYRTLAVLGAPEGMRRASVRVQVGASFALPTAIACTHCIFGFILIGVLSVMFGAEGFLPLAGGTLAFTLCILAVYCLLCIRACQTEV